MVDKNDEDLVFCLRKAREVATHYSQYHVFPAEFPRSVDSLRRVAYNKIAKCEIFRFYPPIPVPHGVVVGGIWQSPGKIWIYVDITQNYCWKRLIECKELFHFFIKHDKYWTKNLLEQVEAVASGFAFPPMSGSANFPAMNPELLALVGAMEFLLPYKERQSILKGSKPPDFSSLSEKYKIPKVLVEKFLEDSYMIKLGEIEAHLDSEV